MTTSVLWPAMSNSLDLPFLTTSAFEIAREAGRIVMKARNEALRIAAKADGSPVTAADQAAEKYIVEALQKLTPDIPVVAEELVASGHGPDVTGRPFWIVDPLDGTKDFIAGEPEFAIVIALVSGDAPVLGVIHGPAMEVTYAGAVGIGATRARNNKAEDITTRIAPQDGITVLSSRRHGSEPELEKYLGEFKIAAHKRMSSALKFGMLASGEADIYPRFGRVMGWDIAAGHAIVLAAGGRMSTATGEAINYRTADFGIPSFIARGRISG